MDIHRTTAPRPRRTPDPEISVSGVARRVATLLMSRDRRRAIRLAQWITAGGIYAGCTIVMALGVDAGWMTWNRLLGWTLFVTVGMTVAYVALRSGWSERFSDPALTEWQIALGVTSVIWGYAITGPMRTAALLPLLIIFSFGAFALRWRQIAVLTGLALVGLGAVTYWSTHFPPPWRDTPAAAGLPVDRVNFLFVMLLLPALAFIAARLSHLRNRLREQREQLTHALAEVQRLATTDELTGLPNRRWMMERLRHEKSRATAEAAPFCLAIIDLDHFKRVNDRQGHAQGDAVLREFAQRARQALPARDTLARWGGEEFLLLMPGIGLQEAATRMDHLRHSVLRIRAGQGPLTFSAGIAQHAGEGDVLDDVRLADKRMYAAKQAGRDRVHAH